MPCRCRSCRLRGGIKDVDGSRRRNPDRQLRALTLFVGAGSILRARRTVSTDRQVRTPAMPPFRTASGPLMKRLAATPVTLALLALPAAAPTWTADEYFKSGRLWVDVRAYGAHVALIGKGNVGDSFGATQNTIVLGSDCTTMAGAAIIRPEWKQLARLRNARPRRLPGAISEVLEEREAPEIRGVTVGGGGLHADGFAQGGTLATTIGINRRTGRMAKFTIQPHGRLQEWIAHDKGYFHAE